MNHSIVATIALLVVTATGVSAFGEECFEARGKINEDAQLIRKTGASMGWSVGKSASITAAGITRGKKELYPLDPVVICLRVDNNVLQIRAQSKSADAGKAEWHNLPAKKRE